MLGLKKAWKFDFFKNVKTKIFIFEYFSKIPSELNSNHHFLPYSDPNTTYVKSSLFFFFVVGGHRGSQKSKNVFYDI